MNTRIKKNILILGGARSGKSSFAQEVASKSGKRILFCATAEPLDEEMRTRILEHKKYRPHEWNTIETTRNIGHEIGSLLDSYDAVIIDCITILVANSMGDLTKYKEAEKRVDSEIHAIFKCMERKRASIILVSNEVGLGLVPENRVGRAYRDILGRANQQLAAHSDEVYFMAAGLPLKLK